MSSVQSLVSSIINTAKTNLKNSPKVDTDVVDFMFGKSSISHESAEYAAAKNTIANYESTVDDIISQLKIANEDFKLTEAQIKAGKVIAAIAANPKRSLEKMASASLPVADNKNTVVVSAESMNVDGFIPNDVFQAHIAQEAFDGQQLNNAIYFSIAYNIGAATQDEFGETVYPTITVSPVESGISVSVEYVAIMKEFLRNTNGTPVGDVNDRVPVIKAMYDNSTFGVDTSAIVPVYRDANKAAFVEAGKYVDDYTTPSAITTAPLKFNQAVDILGISQTDDQLAKGVMDNTDAVDRAVALSKVYFTLGDAGTEELFAYDVSSVASRRFFAPPQGHYKLLTLSFKMSGAGISVSNTKKADGTASTILQGLTNAANHTIILQLSANGELNTESGIVDLNSAPIRLVGVRNANGQLVSETDAAYTEVKTQIDKAKLVGYVLDAKRTNTNVRTRGVVVSNEIYSYLYNVPFRSGITCIKSLVNYSGTENDANRVAAQSQTTGFIISNIAVSTLTNHIESLRAAKDDGALATLSFEGIGSRFTVPYFREESIDLVDVVDSLESNKRDDDVRANLLQRVHNIAMDMIINSNYGPAFKVLKGNSGQKITMVIATDPNIARLIVRDGVSEFEYGDRFKFKVVSTYNKLMSGRIIIVPTVLDANKNTSPDPLNFGFCAYTPTIVYEVSKTTNGAVAGELNTIPRFLHVNNLAIGAVINVSDVSGVFDKIAVDIDMRTVAQHP